jgi:hypothetical protein
MTAVSTFGVFVSADSEIFVAGELIDGLIEAVVLPRDPRARSAVIYNLVHEMCVAVEWLNGSYPELDGATDDELLSLRQVGLAARDHHERMRTLALAPARAVPTSGGTTPRTPPSGREPAHELVSTCRLPRS